MKMAYPAVLFCLLAAAPTGAVLADDRAEMAEIREQLRQLGERLAALEARQDVSSTPQAAVPTARITVAAGLQTAPAALVEKKAAADWSDRVGLSGDLRYRHESIDEQTRDTRTRQRVRARIGLKAKVAPNAEVGVRLASGSDDPISTNQTLDGGASTKRIGLDRAYLRLSPGANSRLIAGKMSNPLYRAGGSSLVWDSDLSPEGLAWTFEGEGFFANAAAFWIEERSSASDSLLYAAQAGYGAKLTGGATLTAGLGYYDYSATQGRSAFFDGEGRGNTLTADGEYANDYDLTEAFAVYSTTLAELPFSLFAHWIQNGAVSDNDTGYLLGARIGKASDRGKWQFGYSFRELQADAVVATFADSDIGGGGTAIRGHAFEVGYGFSRRIGARLTYFVSENGLDTIASRDYDRLQADVSLKY